MGFSFKFSHIIKIIFLSILFLVAQKHVLSAAEAGRIEETKSQGLIAQITRVDSERSTNRRETAVNKVFKNRIVPHWFVFRTPDGADNTCFWYRNDLIGNSKEFILVNAERGTRQAAFDHQKLASALSRAAG